jgi:hypothetical protein
MNRIRQDGRQRLRPTPASGNACWIRTDEGAASMVAYFGSNSGQLGQIGSNSPPTISYLQRRLLWPFVSLKEFRESPVRFKIVRILEATFPIMRSW